MNDQRFSGIPLILETPGGDDDSMYDVWKREIQALVSRVQGICMTLLVALDLEILFKRRLFFSSNFCSLVSIPPSEYVIIQTFSLLSYSINFKAYRKIQKVGQRFGRS